MILLFQGQLELIVSGVAVVPAVANGQKIILKTSWWGDDTISYLK